MIKVLKTFSEERFEYYIKEENYNSNLDTHLDLLQVSEYAINSTQNTMLKARTHLTHILDAAISFSSKQEIKVIDLNVYISAQENYNNILSGVKLVQTTKYPFYYEFADAGINISQEGSITFVDIISDRRSGKTTLLTKLYNFAGCLYIAHNRHMEVYVRQEHHEFNVTNISSASNTRFVFEKKIMTLIFDEVEHSKVLQLVYQLKVMNPQVEKWVVIAART